MGKASCWKGHSGGWFWSGGWSPTLVHNGPSKLSTPSRPSPWSLGSLILGSLELRIPVAWGPWNLGFLELGVPGFWDSWSSGFLELRVPVPWGPWSSGFLDLVVPGTQSHLRYAGCTVLCEGKCLTRTTPCHSLASEVTCSL